MHGQIHPSYIWLTVFVLITYIYIQLPWRPCLAVLEIKSFKIRDFLYRKPRNEMTEEKNFFLPDCQNYVSNYINNLCDWRNMIKFVYRHSNMWTPRLRDNTSRWIVSRFNRACIFRLRHRFHITWLTSLGCLWKQSIRSNNYSLVFTSSLLHPVSGLFGSHMSLLCTFFDFNQVLD